MLSTNYEQKDHSEIVVKIMMTVLALPGLPLIRISL